MCQFFDKRGYPVFVVQAGHHRAQQIDRQSALQTAEKVICCGAENFRSKFSMGLRSYRFFS